MKCAVVLIFVCVAASQAAFTENLVELVQPTLQQALFNARLSSRSSKFQTLPLVDHLQQQYDSLLNQIQTTVAIGQFVAHDITSDFQNVASQLGSLGVNTVQNAGGALQNLFGNIWGNIFGPRGKSFTVDSLLFEGQNIYSGLVGDLQTLHQHALALVSQLDLPTLLQNAINAITGQLQTRNGILGMFGQIQAASQQVAADVQALVQQLTATAGGAFNQVHALALDFVNSAQTQIHVTISHAADKMIDFLKPYQQSLGGLYEQAVSQVAGLVGN